MGIKLISHLANCSPVKELHGLRLGFLKNLSEIGLNHRATLCVFIVEELFKDLLRVHHGLLAFIFADIAPRRFDRGDSASVDGVNIRLGEVVEHFSVEWSIVELLDFDSVHDFPSQGVDLFDELWPEGIQRNVSQVL